MLTKRHLLFIRIIFGVIVIAFFSYQFYRRGFDGTFNYMTDEEFILPALSMIIVALWLKYAPGRIR